MDFSPAAYMILGLAAFFSGISKTGVPGLGILGVVLVPMIIPAKLSTGYVLPFLIFADVMAVIYWRKAAVWRHIIAVLPSMLFGIFIGYLLMDRIDDAAYGKVLGAIVVFIISFDWARRRFALSIPADSRPVAWSMGFLAGLMTMLANAAGPVMMIYLLAMNISKEEFVGTNAWLYFIVNLSKVPFSMHLGLITPDSFWVNAVLLPSVVAGGIAGVFVMRAIPEKAFNTLMRLLAFAGGVKLFF
jgi:uncharacterized membrane protein YfcA